MSPRHLPAFIVMASLTGAATAAAQVENGSRLGWAVMDAVFDLARVDNTVYVAGGVGNGLAMNSGGGDEPFVVFDTATGLPSPAAFTMRAPEDNSVNSVVNDGAGGWYAGGTFSRVGSAPRSGLARLTRTTPDPNFAPALNGSVNALLLDGNTLYVAGGFTTVNGQARGGGAAFDHATGALLPWNPQLDALPFTRAATALAKAGSTIFLGGTFTTASGTARQGLAAVDATTGALLSTPAPALNANGAVNTLLLSGNTLFVGGGFSSIAGATRNNLAAIDATTGAVLPFQANTTGAVRSLLLDGSTLYVGGGFRQLGGQARTGIGRVAAATGAVDAWTANTNGPVIALLLRDSALYMGGAFGVVAGQPRLGAAAVSTATGVPLPLNPGLGGGPVNVLLATGSSEIVVAGSFTHVGAVSRPGIAAFDLVTNEPQPPFIDVDGNVRSITVVGNTLYLSGQFTRVNNQGRNSFAAIDRHSGELLPWNPNATGTISAGALGNQSGGRAVVVTGSTAFIGGYFTSVGGQPRTGVAQVDATTGAVTSFVADTTGGGVNKLVRDGQTLYVGGLFAGIAGQVRQSLAAFDLAPASPALLPFSVAIAGNAKNVATMEVVGSTLYFGGSWASVNGQAQNAAAAVTVPGGVLTPFRPGLNGPVSDIDVLGGTAYLAGAFSTVNGAPRLSFATVDAATGQTNGAFAPDMPPFLSGQRVVATPEGLLAGGRIPAANLQFFPTTGLGGLPGRPAAPATSLLPPGAPPGLFIVWGEPALGGDPTDYQLEIGTGPGLANVGTVSAPDQEFFYQGVVPPGFFYARVRAVNAFGVGPASPEIGFATGVPGCLGIGPAPLLRSAVSGSDVTLTWFDPPLFPGALDYALDLGTTTGAYNVGTFPLGATNQIAASAPPAAYFLRLRAQGPCGVPAPSPEHLVSVGGVLPLDAPVLSAQVSGANVSLGVTSVSGATGYLLDVGFGPLHSVLSVPMPVTGLSAVAPPGTYYLRAYAVGGPTGISSASNEITVVVP